MAPFLLVSHSLSSPSLLAVSPKQTRTLRCGLRYTGLASWPCSVHHTTTTTRCTEPLRHQPSVTLCHPLRLWLACCFCHCWHTHYHTTHQTDYSLSPEFTSQTVAAGAAAKLSLLRNTPFQLISQVLLFVNGGVTISFPAAVPNTQILQFSRFFFSDFCHNVIDIHV